MAKFSLMLLEKLRAMWTKKTTEPNSTNTKVVLMQEVTTFTLPLIFFLFLLCAIKTVVFKGV